MPTAPHMYAYHDAGDPGGMYGIPVGYGMYPHANDSNNEVLTPLKRIIIHSNFRRFYSISSSNTGWHDLLRAV